MIRVIDGNSRGATRLGWLDSKHTFSFGEYYNPEMMGFGPLRVINEDVVEPGQGFGSHPHRDMEIITYVCDGSLQHKDSMGTGEIITAGEVQHMSAGRGVIHSEFNASSTTPVHFYQIWIIPDKKGVTPVYSQKRIDWQRNTWIALAGPKHSHDVALQINQDVEIFAARIDAHKTLQFSPARSKVWVQIASGQARINDKLLTAGDGAAVQDEKSIPITAESDVEVLVFDLPELQ
jgi:quercetin 2,3-dioxygenase